MISKQEFKKIERQYDTWLYRHPKGDHNYKSFSHMRRSIEFAKHYSGYSTEETLANLQVMLPPALSLLTILMIGIVGLLLGACVGSLTLRFWDKVKNQI